MRIIILLTHLMLQWVLRMMELVRFTRIMITLSGIVAHERYLHILYGADVIGF